MASILTVLQQSGLLMSVAIFIAVAALVLFSGLLIVPAIETRRRVTERLLAEGAPNRRSMATQDEITKIASRRPVEAYFRAAEKERGEPDALDAKLFRAYDLQFYPHRVCPRRFFGRLFIALCRHTAPSS
jgi:tight adherence protein C